MDAGFLDDPSDSSISAKSGKIIWLEGKIEHHVGNSEKAAGLGHNCDPDAGSRELLIEWDIWRNKVANQVNKNLSKHLHGFDGCEIDPMTRRVQQKFPYDIHTGIKFVIDNHQQILEAVVINSSGYPKYDQLVLESVRELSKKRQVKLLVFPEFSRRNQVGQLMDYSFLNRLSHPEKQRFIKFNDVEKVEVK